MEQLKENGWKEIQKGLNDDALNNEHENLKEDIKALFDFYVPEIKSCGTKVYTRKFDKMDEEFQEITSMT